MPDAGTRRTIGLALQGGGAHAAFTSSGLPTVLLGMLSALPEELIHLRNFVQDEKSAPYDGRSWWPVMLAIQVGAEHAYPQYDLLQRWNLLWQLRRSVGVAIQRLPFNWLQQYFAAQLRIGSREQCCIQDVPRDDGKQSSSSHKPQDSPHLRERM